MIRPMEQNDLDLVMELWLHANLDAHPFVERNYWLSHYDPVKKLLPKAKVYVYEAEDGLLGFAGIEGEYLAGIFVRQEARSRGVGQKLLTHIKTLLPQITLNVYQENRRAVEFYLREGFRIVSAGTDQDTGKPDFLMVWNNGQGPEEDWERLYQAAMGVAGGREISPWMEAGQVAAAVLTPQGHIYTGICMDTACSLGMCAERNAVAHMLTCGESKISKVAAVSDSGKVILPCGACRELLMQLGSGGKEIQVLVDYPQIKTQRLGELAPNWWGMGRKE